MEKECKGTSYTIVQGDTLYNISRKYQVPLAWILRANPYLDVYNLQVGETICIPSGDAMNPPMHRPPMHRPPMHQPVHRPPMHRPPANRPPMQRPPMQQPMPMPPEEAYPPEVEYPPENGSGSAETPDCPACMLISYVVEDGDSVGSLLERFRITLAELLEHNSVDDLKLAEGTVLKLMEDTKD